MSQQASSLFLHSFQFPKLKQDSNYIKKTDASSKRVFRKTHAFSKKSVMSSKLLLLIIHPLIQSSQ